MRVISISDEVYSELSKMKDGKSFTVLLKTLLSECANKGDAKSIATFLKSKGPLSEESEKNIIETSEKGRKNATARNLQNSTT